MSNDAISERISGEVPFSFEELFFSRTDARGIILSGNSVFQRISMYEWEELLKKPHNLIRHPDMPKAVFWLLWHTIKKGEPIGAYVKNRAKDGRHYWVFAIVTPIDGGFLSVRLKPSSALMPVVEQEYAALVARERSEKLSAADSAALLLARLGELGFNQYSEFMSAALSKEIAARGDKLARPRNETISCFDELMESAQSLLRQAAAISAAYEKNEYVPLNLQVQSAQLGGSGATIGVISSNYNVISTEIRQNIGRFIASARDVFSKINDGLFLMCTADIQSEVIEFFRQEPANAHIDLAGEMAYLEQQQKAYRMKAASGLHAIVAQAERFREDCQEMKRLALGLQVTRLMGKVESSRLTVIKDGLNELIDDLESFQTAVTNGLKEIDQMNRAIRHNTQKLLAAAG